MISIVKSFEDLSNIVIKKDAYLKHYIIVVLKEHMILQKS